MSIGRPPGYVGYEEGGQLTEAVRRKPYSVVLVRDGAVIRVGYAGDKLTVGYENTNSESTAST